MGKGRLFGTLKKSPYKKRLVKIQNIILMHFGEGEGEMKIGGGGHLLVPVSPL